MVPSAEPMAIAALSGWTSEQMAGARGRGGKPLYSGDAAGPAPIQDAEAPGAGRGRPISDGRLCRTLRAREIPETMLVRIKSAGHIPMESDPKVVAGALARFFAAAR